MVTCNNCKREARDEEQICEVCNYPIQGTDKEKAVFIAKQVTQKSDVQEAIQRVKTSRIILFVIGAFYLVMPFISAANRSSNFVLGINIFLGLLFLGFGFLSLKKPKIALLIPLILIVMYYLLLLFIDPYYLWTGVLWKVIILVGIGYGYFSVSKADKILKNNPYLASTFGFNSI
ncbi:MAG: hypothetical protein ACPGJS_06870 [Flammeovirgaceae bacterium]